jgi:endonuclease YncB( thermonuclease family)
MPAVEDRRLPQWTNEVTMITSWAAVSAIIAIVILTLVTPARAGGAIDGDTIELQGNTFNLHGIDAAEFAQVCADGWPAGYEARAYLAALIDGREVRCVAVPVANNENAAICRADGVDLGAAMVTGGHAMAHVPFSARYVAEEAAAASAKRGIHAHSCTPPWRWRARIDRHGERER